MFSDRGLQGLSCWNDTYSVSDRQIYKLMFRFENSIEGRTKTNNYLAATLLTSGDSSHWIYAAHTNIWRILYAGILVIG